MIKVEPIIVVFSLDLIVMHLQAMKEAVGTIELLTKGDPKKTFDFLCNQGMRLWMEYNIHQGARVITTLKKARRKGYNSSTYIDSFFFEVKW